MFFNIVIANKNRKQLWEHVDIILMLIIIIYYSINWKEGACVHNAE